MKKEVQPGISRKIVIMALCLVCSIVFWLLTTLSEDHSSQLELRIKFSGLPANLAIDGDDRPTVMVKVKSRGFQLLSVNPPSEVVLPLALPLEVESGKETQYQVNLNRFMDKINQQLGSKYKVLEIKPDSVLLDFKSFASKKVPVALASDISFAPNYGFGGKVTISPDSVIIAGPVDKINAMQKVFTQTPPKNLKNNVNKVLPVLVSPGLKATPEAVKVTFPVAELTEAFIELPIKIIGLPDSLVMITNPAKCKVYFQWPVYFDLKGAPVPLQVQVDYRDQQNHRIKKLIPVVPDVPGYIKITRIEPALIEYIVEVK